MKLFIIFIAFLSHCGSAEGDDYSNCPSGKPGTMYGTDAWSYYCNPDNYYVFAVYTGPNLCCEEASFHQCTHTGMVSRHYVGIYTCGPIFTTMRESYTAHELIPFVYIVHRGDRWFTCPYPIGYLWYSIYKPKETDLPPAEFLPIDHIDVQTQLKTCQANQNCGIDQFCGDVINRSYDLRVKGKCVKKKTDCKIHLDCYKYDNDDRCDLSFDNVPYADLTQHFCYKRPAITADIVDKSQYAMQSSARNMAFCQNNNDCANGADTSGQCHLGLAPTDDNGVALLWTEFVPNPNVKIIGERRTHAGLCIQAKPFAYIFSIMFENLPAADKQGDLGKAYMPVDFVIGKYRDQLKKCAKNSECLAKQFCGNIFSLTHPANFDTFNTFCFAVPEVAAPYNANTKYTIVPEGLNLVACNTNQDCRTGGLDGNSFCILTSGQQFARTDGSQRLSYKGLCAEAKVCDTSGINGNGHFWESGGVPVSNTCDKNADCDGGGNTMLGDNAQETFENTCVKAKTIPNVNLCCYRKTGRCKYGKVVQPALRCGQNTVNPLARDGPFAECYGGLPKVLDQSTRLDTWCDWTIEQCCQDPTIGFCPDGQTPLFNEPKCSGYDELNPKSGLCPAIGAMCQFGHCCPKVEPDGNGKLEKPEYSYLTNQACQPGIRPLQFLGGYCDPDSGMVVIVGKLSTDGKPLTKLDNPATCLNDAQCSTDKSKVCIHEEPTMSSVAHCYLNPKITAPQTNASEEADGGSPMLIIIIVLIALIVIVLAALIGGFVFYKLKMKNKKKGNNKKKKGKGKGKDKKKGKKGKKAKKTSKTSTTSTTSKSASITGKTGTGVSTGGSPSVF